MTTKQINIIKTTWQAAATNADLVGHLFYNRLFEIAPEVKPLFSSTTIPEQSKKLFTMLTYVISKLDTGEDIINELTRLAQRHVKYGVEEKHYNYVGAALLWTLEKGLGDMWNLEVKQAWATCYAALSFAMITASGYAEQEVV